MIMLQRLWRLPLVTAHVVLQQLNHIILMTGHGRHLLSDVQRVTLILRYGQLRYGHFAASQWLYDPVSLLTGLLKTQLLHILTS